MTAKDACQLFFYKNIKTAVFLCFFYMVLTKQNAYFMPNEGYQPKSFPRRQFEKNVIVNRSFQTTWSDRFKWLNCDTGNDSALCFVCCKAVKDVKVSLAPNAEERFLFNQPGNCVCRNFQLILKEWKDVAYHDKVKTVLEICKDETMS